MDKNTLNFLSKLKNCSASKNFIFKFFATQKIKNIVIKLYSLGLIRSFKISKTKYFYFNITLYLKFECPLKNLKIISTPSKKKFLNFKNITKLQISLSTTIIFSTNKGIFAHSDCLKNKVGGIVLFSIW